MNGKEISTPVGIAIAAVALMIVLGIGFWYMNRSVAAGGGSVEERTAAINAHLKDRGDQHH